MKLDLWEALSSIIEAGGVFRNGIYEIRYRDGLLHREDGPAIACPDGTQEWYRNGTIHRDGGPALIYQDGTQVWYQNDEIHRDDGPAIIHPDGTEIWCQDGQRKHKAGD